MKRTIVAMLLTVMAMAATAQVVHNDRYYYVIRIYHYTTEAQGARLDSFLQTAYLPALHNFGILKAGVFKPVANDSLGLRTYVFIPLKNLAQFEKLLVALEADERFQVAGKPFIDAAFNDVPFKRYETILLQSFTGAPVPTESLLNGPKEARVYELRSYESPTDGLAANKIRMFNKGDEMGIFNRLHFNAVFYGAVMAGAHMPNLMYMTSFENMADRDAHWKSFSSDAYWKTLSGDPRYEHNVSHMDIVFLHPAAYSEY